MGRGVGVFLSSIGEEVNKSEVNRSSASWKSVLRKWNYTGMVLALSSADL